MDLQQIDDLEKKLEESLNKEEQVSELENHLEQEPSTKEVKTPKKGGVKNLF